MDSSASTLTPLQTRLLQVFRDVDGVWLTGGGALGGFHLGHRRSHDLFALAETGVEAMAWPGTDPPPR